MQAEELDPRIAELKGLKIQVKGMKVGSVQEGDYEGEWSARSMKKKFRKRKFTIYFNSILSYTPTGIEFFDVVYVGTTGLKVVRITEKKFVCEISTNDIGSTAKVEFKWKTVIQ